MHYNLEIRLACVHTSAIMHGIEIKSTTQFSHSALNISAATAAPACSASGDTMPFCGLIPTAAVQLAKIKCYSIVNAAAAHLEAHTTPDVQHLLFNMNYGGITSTNPSHVLRAMESQARRRLNGPQAALMRTTAELSKQSMVHGTPHPPCALRRAGQSRQLPPPQQQRTAG